MTYTYDPHRNLKTAKDARGITATLSYDVLNRLTSKTYNDGVTQPETWTYDPNIANGSGRVGSVSNGNSVTNYLSYDGMGNILSSNQQTLGQTYSFSYTWNLAGALTSETYPSGRKVTTTYDGVNRLSAVNGQMGSTATAYMDHMYYLAQGAPSYFRMGNNVWRNFAYNREQQAGCHWDGIGGNPSYALFEECPSWGTANNNGTLKSNAVGAGGPTLLTSLPTMTATYGYDNLNRLTSASDSGGWARNWGYDRYGNMWMTNATGVPGSPLTPSSSGYFTSANRILGQSYDAAGNQTNYSTYTLTYNATNELTKVADATSGGSVQYTYDAAGRRISKQFSDGAQRVFVYDALGQLAAEYSNAAQAPEAPCATCYLSTDYLGSVRMITDETGVAVARHDYLPFGEEVPGNMAGRSMLFGQDASVNQKFTGKERDAESNLDFFEARFMSSLQGRFLSADPFSAGADVGDPQSFNAYSYALNTPLTGTDPTGRSFVPCKSPDSIACVGNDPTPSDNHDGGSAGWINCWWCFLGIGGYGNQSQQPHIPPPPPLPTPFRFVVFSKTLNNGTKQADARARCVNDLLLQATVRGVASFVGLPPTEPSLGDLAGLVKDAVDSPAFRVAAIYTATNVAKRIATKKVASRFAAKVGSTFIPGVGEVAGAIIVGQAVWDGFSWYKDQIEGGACEIP